jgi:hypothetical protein
MVYYVALQWLLHCKSDILLSPPVNFWYVLLNSPLTMILNDFQCAIVRRGMSSDGLVEETQAIMHRHGRSIVQATLQGVAIVAPRSTLPNLSELLSTLVFKLPNESCKWAQDVLFSVRYTAVTRII